MATESKSKAKLLVPQAGVVWGAAHSPAIKSGEHHIDIPWLILSTEMDYWNSKIKGEKGLRTYSLSHAL